MKRIDATGLTPSAFAGLFREVVRGPLGMCGAPKYEDAFSGLRLGRLLLVTYGGRAGADTDGEIFTELFLPEGFDFGIEEGTGYVVTRLELDVSGYETEYQKAP